MKPGRTRLWLALIAACGLAYTLLAYWLTTAQGIAALGALAPYVAWVYYLQHVTMFLALGAAFGLSLRQGREALCTRFARAVEGSLSAAGAAYSRGVTIAWAAFCAAMIAASTLLFFLAPLEAWSVFANLLTLPLVGAMFVAESLVRARVCPELGRGGVLRDVTRSLQAFRDVGVRPTPGPR